MPPKTTSLLTRLRSRGVLYRAWAHVYEKAVKSKAVETQHEALAFSNNHVRNIERIADQLRKNAFRFEPQHGILISKPGKKGKRPVVVAPIQSRIVQRAILDLIQLIPAIRQQLTQGYNFGGVEGSSFGVPSAVRKAQQIALACPYYIRTDIKSFFTKVPRSQALDRVLAHIDDPAFRDLVVDATTTELDDAEKYGTDVSLFPIHEAGVAQGSCLSPLLCNLLLADFDEQMNGRGITCIRYIDDFILFGRTKAATFKALDSGINTLSALGLDVYDPRSASDEDRKKSAHGKTADGFRFLGCEIQGTQIRPTKSNRDRLKSDIREIFDTAAGALSKPKQAAFKGNTFAGALAHAGRVIRGWGNTHHFCTDPSLMRSLDGELGAELDDFRERVQKKLNRMDKSDRRRALGFFLLEDCNVTDSEAMEESRQESRGRAGNGR